MTKMKLCKGSKEDGTYFETTVTKGIYDLWDKAEKKKWRKVSDSSKAGKDLHDPEMIKKYDQAKANAKKLIDEGSFEVAIGQFEEAMKINPNATSYCKGEINKIKTLIEESQSATTTDGDQAKAGTKTATETETDTIDAKKAKGSAKDQK